MLEVVTEASMRAEQYEQLTEVKIMTHLEKTSENFGTGQDNKIDRKFEKRKKSVIDIYFSRDSKYWSFFGDPSFKNIVDFRKQNLNPDERIGLYPHGEMLHEKLKEEENIPEKFNMPGIKYDDILEFSASLSKDWENPASVENVITMPCDPAIYGSMIGSLCNANLVHYEYSQMASELEKSVVRQMANLSGYDPENATGIFTQGGTFCNLYGYLLGIRKSLSNSIHHGLPTVHDYRMINSQGGHYSNISYLSLLGVNIKTKVIRIKITENNNIDMEDLEKQLTACFQLKIYVTTIMLTMGTTDTFGIDHVKPVYDLRNRLCEKYEVEIKPHIHVDSAIGWAILFFLDYDFDENPLYINKRTLDSLRKITGLFSELKYADSYTIDFQKWGYVPYTSSLVMIKDKADLKYLENDPDNFSYFEKHTQGQSHLQSTIECSRGASGTFGAYAALKYLGKEGYQVTIAHCLQNANYFRYRLSQLQFVKVVAIQNQGPSVGFRIYNPDDVINADEEYQYECDFQDTGEYLQRVERNSAYHRKLFLDRGKVGLYTNWVEFIARTEYDEKGRFHKFPGEKAVFMNPLTTRKEIDIYIENICGTWSNI